MWQKTCSLCHQVKAIYCFEESVSCRDKHRNQCRACRNIKKRASQNKRYHENPQFYLGKTRDWGRRNRDKVRAYKLANWKALRMSALDYYGSSHCRCCGESTLEFLCIDHIEGDGAKHRREMKGKIDGIYRWLKQNNYPTGFRVLCYNCNSSIGHYGYCPHQETQVV